ncbi:hypothetical protein ACFRJ1_15720 [Streptomyces sp. NPDC056773]|uniref:hypothetical protein n=1 Tax=unclassified Streptomyces TaxID=2593676 RepID=UPI0036A1D288
MLKIIGSLGDVAEGQEGMVTEQQAAALGATGRVVQEFLDSRVIELVLPGVFRLRGGARPAFPRLYAHWLLLAPQTPAWERPLPEAGVVSHGSALRLYGVGSLPGPVAEFTTPYSLPAEATEGVLIHRAELQSEEYREVAGLPVTVPARTFVDIATAGIADSEGLGRIATNFLNHGLTTHAELAQALEQQAPSGPGSGAAQLDVLLAGVDGAESHTTPRAGE